MFQRLIATNNSVEQFVLRMVLGIVFFAHGSQKMLGWFGGEGFHATMQGLSGMMPAALAFLVICAEFFGALGVFFGFLTRVAAFGIFAVMVGAILTVHMKNGLFMNWAGNQKGEGFEYHLLVIAISLGLMIAGAGAASVDRGLTRRER